MEVKPRFDLDYADRLANWIIDEADRLSQLPPAYQTKVYDTYEISLKEGLSKFLTHAREICQILNGTARLSDDLTRLTISARKKERQ